MKKLLAATLAATLIATPVAMAKSGFDGEGRGHKGHPMKMLKQLDLSSEQKQQIKDIMEQARANAERPSAEERQQMFELRMAIVEADSFDSTAANAFIDAQQAKMKQRQLKMLEVQHQVFQVLNDEQKAEYKKLAAERMNKMAERMEKKGKGRS